MQKERYSKELVRIASGVRGIFCDVEGVLTNGKIWCDESGRQMRQFHVQDGRIISFLKKAGLIVGVISEDESEAVNQRCAELKMDFCHQGIIDKFAAVEKLARHYGFKLKEVLYIGNDLDDLRVFRAVGMSACPADAPLYIRKEADLVTRRSGGEGVLREVADFVLATRGELEKILNALK